MHRLPQWLTLELVAIAVLLALLVAGILAATREL
jgi:hypothetical protein